MIMPLPVLVPVIVSVLAPVVIVPLVIVSNVLTVMGPDIVAPFASFNSRFVKLPPPESV